MQNAPSEATGEAMPAASPATATPAPAVDPGYALIRAIPPSAATFVHNAIMDMLRAPPAPR